MQNQLKRIRKFNIRFALRKMQNSPYSKRAIATTQKRPFLSFFIALAILFGLIIGGNILASLGKKDIKEQAIVKEVETYKIGESPKITLQAKIEKKGVIKIVAQSSGIVNAINVTEGQTVGAGTVLVSLASNYQGGNASSVQRQIAGAQYKNTTDTFNTQKELIQKQREIADKSRENTEELRKITNDSLGETRNSISDNESLLKTIDEYIGSLNQATQAETIAMYRGQRNQLQSGINQLRSGLRQAEYQVGTDNPPTELAQLQKDITLKQLDVQEKALNLGKEVAGLQYTLASINEAQMYPAAPFQATVQKINVQKGQNVTPGTVLATISCLTPQGTAVINVPRNIAYSISRVEPSVFTIGNKKISLVPTYVATEATDGQLYSIVYSLPQIDVKETTNEEFISAEVPVGLSSSTSATPYVPIDTVYQNQNEAYVFILNGATVKSKKVTLGAVYGRYVEITQGLDKGDQIVLSRNVVTGDKIRVTN